MVASGNARNRRWPQRFSSLTKTGGVKEKEMKGTRRKQRQCRSKREVVEDIEIWWRWRDIEKSNMCVFLEKKVCTEN